MCQCAQLGSRTCRAARLQPLLEIELEVYPANSKPGWMSVPRTAYLDFHPSCLFDFHLSSLSGISSVSHAPTGDALRLTGLMSVTERCSRSKGDGSTMSDGRRILLALRDPWLAAALRDALVHAPDLQLIGIIDPTIDRALSGWRAYADILLIGADELLWLQRSGSCGALAASAAMRVIVLLDESRILDLFHQIDPPFDLLLDVDDGRLLAERIDLAAAGYVVLSASLLMRWVSNHLRRRLIDDLSPNEQRVLTCVGRALSNKGIAAETGFAEAEVKVLVQSVLRKLRMKNRTTVAVFAATVHPTGNGSAG